MTTQNQEKGWKGKERGRGGEGGEGREGGRGGRREGGRRRKGGGGKGHESSELWPHRLVSHLCTRKFTPIHT